MELLSCRPIGVFRTCFKDKFGIPRQPGLAAGATGVIQLVDEPPELPRAQLALSLKGLETFSHIWAVFVFHRHDARRWKPTIRPPRLGGARKVGVLASRSPHRPNPIGLSALKLERIDLAAPGGIELHVSGVDVLDGTPVLDIKPYVPYADLIPEATSGWAAEPIARTSVEFTEQSRRAVAEREPAATGGSLRGMITEVLSLDPRPASLRRREPPGSPEAQGTRHGFRLLDYDVKWEIRDGGFTVTDVVDF